MNLRYKQPSARALGQERFTNMRARVATPEEPTMPYRVMMALATIATIIAAIWAFEALTAPACGPDTCPMSFWEAPQ